MRSWPGLILSGLAIGLVAGSASAQQRAHWEINCPARLAEDFPVRMTYTRHRAAGRTIVIAAGQITAGDAVKLSRYLRNAGRVDEIWLDSPGGNAAEGPRIGEVIRKAGIATRVPNGFMCGSSCTLAFLGGVARFVEPGGGYAVHTFFAEGFLDLVGSQTRGLSPTAAEAKTREMLHQAEQRNALLAADWQRYIQQMGVSRMFLTEIVLPVTSLYFSVARTSDGRETLRRGNDIKCMDRASLLKYNVVNVE